MTLDKEKVDLLFEEEKDQADVLVKLYKMVYPDWDRIEKINGFPTISKETNEYIFDKFFAFDKKYHGEVFMGGLWLNNGFSSLEGQDLSFMEVRPVDVVYK